MGIFQNRVYGGGATSPICADTLVPKTFSEFFVGFSAKDRKKFDMEGMYREYMRVFSEGLRSVEATFVETASPSPSLKSRSSCSSVAARLRRLDTWRARSSVESLQSVSSQSSVVIEDGFCYLSMVKPDKRTEVARLLGEWPTFAALATLPQDKVEVASLGVLKVGFVDKWDRCHVGLDAGMITLEQVLASVHAPAERGRLSGLLRPVDSLPGYSLSTRVGGSDATCVSVVVGDGHGFNVPQGCAVLCATREEVVGLQRQYARDGHQVVVRTVGESGDREYDHVRLHQGAAGGLWSELEFVKLAMSRASKSMLFISSVCPPAASTVDIQVARDKFNRMVGSDDSGLDIGETWSQEQGQTLEYRVADQYVWE